MKSPACHVAMEVSNIVTPQSIAKDKRVTKWSIEDFNIGRRLGEGSYSTVILVEEKKTGFLCALKVIKVRSVLLQIPAHVLFFSRHCLEITDSTIQSRTSTDPRIRNSYATFS